MKQIADRITKNRSVTGVFLVSATYGCLSNCARLRPPTDDQYLVCFYSLFLIAHVLGLLLMISYLCF